MSNDNFQPISSIQCEWLDTKSAAKFLGVSPQFLENERWKKRGPVYARLHSRCRYSKRDLMAYMDARLIDSSTNQ